MLLDLRSQLVQCVDMQVVRIGVFASFVAPIIGNTHDDASAR